MADYDYDETEDVDLVEIRMGDNRVGHAGIAKASGMVYVSGEIHPLGAATSLIKAAKEHVPYIAVSAVEVLYPADWLRGECLHDPDRLRIINNLERFTRGQ